MAWQVLSKFKLGLMRLGLAESRTRQILRANHSSFSTNLQGGKFFRVAAEGLGITAESGDGRHNTGFYQHVNPQCVKCAPTRLPGLQAFNQVYEAPSGFPHIDSGTAKDRQSMAALILLGLHDNAVGCIKHRLQRATATVGAEPHRCILVPSYPLDQEVVPLASRGSSIIVVPEAVKGLAGIGDAKLRFAARFHVNRRGVGRLLSQCWVVSLSPTPSVTAG